jgi:Isochorismate hydrolase
VTAPPFALDATLAALVVVDLQNDFVRVGAPQEVPSARTTLGNVAALANALRATGRPVLYTRYTAGPSVTHLGWFSPECGPEMRSCWPGVQRRYGDRDGLLEGHQIVDELTPHAGDLVIDKYGYGSFHNTSLEDALLAAPARQVWLVGTVTQICVEESAREGYRRGFEMVVAADAVSSFDDDLHRATLRNLAAKFALVTDTAALLSAIDAAPRGTPRAPPGPPVVRTRHSTPTDPDAEESPNG